MWYLPDTLDGVEGLISDLYGTDQSAACGWVVSALGPEISEKELSLDRQSPDCEELWNGLDSTN